VQAQVSAARGAWCKSAYSAAYRHPWSEFAASSGGVIGEIGSGTIDNPQISVWFQFWHVSRVDSLQKWREFPDHPEND
jgi:hypothetical protein